MLLLYFCAKFDTSLGWRCKVISKIKQEKHWKHIDTTGQLLPRRCQVLPGLPHWAQCGVTQPSQCRGVSYVFLSSFVLDEAWFLSEFVFQSQRIAWSHVYDSLWCFEEHLEVLPLSACICCMLLRKPSPTFASTPAAPQKVWTAEWDLWTSMEVPIATVRMSHGQNRST